MFANQRIIFGASANFLENFDARKKCELSKMNVMDIQNTMMTLISNIRNHISELNVYLEKPITNHFFPAVCRTFEENHRLLNRLNTTYNAIDITQKPYCDNTEIINTITLQLIMTIREYIITSSFFVYILKHI
jgi:arsenate reductase-like glutaredoxin family protein